MSNVETDVKYGVFVFGGSIGSTSKTSYVKYFNDRGHGKLVKLFDNAIDAKKYALERRSNLSIGEKKTYKMIYLCKKLTILDRQEIILKEIYSTLKSKNIL